ncbi:MAG: flagellar biosynthesis anti-sigma factor FlgM [Vicinamibacterales bacterium]
MKIDGYAQAQAQAADMAAMAAGTRQVSGERQAKTETAGASGSDQVIVSADAQLLSAALKAAEGQPAIRTELVEQMRAKLAAGEIGNDPVRLADRLIDGLLEG